MQRIRKRGNFPARAVCQFQYRGYEVSVSTVVLVDSPEIVVFSEWDSSLQEGEFRTVEDAIEFINNKVRR